MLFKKLLQRVDREAAYFLTILIFGRSGSVNNPSELPDGLRNISS